MNQVDKWWRPEDVTCFSTLMHLDLKEAKSEQYTT